MEHGHKLSAFFLGGDLIIASAGKLINAKKIGSKLPIFMPW